MTLLFRWKVGKWSKCHACKNRSGVRMREVVCVEESPKPGTEDILVDDDKCKGTKPGTMELCESHMKCKARSADGGDAVPSADIPSALMEEVWSQINRRDRRNQDVVRLPFLYFCSVETLFYFRIWISWWPDSILTTPSPV